MSTQAYDIVKLARSNKRPTGLDYIQNLCGDFLELHGDRCYADDAAIVGGVGHFRGIPVTFVAIEKGHSAKERMSRFFGAPHPEGYRKALRLMRQAEPRLFASGDSRSECSFTSFRAFRIFSSLSQGPRRGSSGV